MATTLMSTLKNTITELRTNNEYKEVFCKFQDIADIEERIRFLSEQSTIKEKTNVNFTNYTKKDKMEAERLRLVGNTAFKKHNYEEALVMYTDSVLYAPLDSEEMALGFANRSAVLYSMGIYEACLLNIKNALENGYPEDLRYKLLDRKGRCYEKIGDITQAQNCIEEAASHVETSKLDKKGKERMKNELDKLGENLQTMLIKNKSNNAKAKSVLPEVTGGHNKFFPCATDAVTIKYNEHRGRHMVATRDIEVCDVLAVEDPHCLYLYPVYRRKNCYNCSRKLFNCVPCKRCSDVAFCSTQCRDNAWSMYHYIECECLNFLNDNATLALHIILGAGLSRLLQGEDKLSEELDSMTFGIHKGYSSDYQAVSSLLSHEEARQPEIHFSTAISTIIILKLLNKVGFFVGTTDDERENNLSDDQLIVGRQIFHLLYARSNSHSVYDQPIGQTDECKIGFVLYPTISLINHSCDPSAFYCTWGNKCILTAKKGIKKGEEVSMTYKPLFDVTSKMERQLYLLENYFFKCECEACINNWPCTDRNTAMYSVPMYKCRHCGEGVDFPYRCSNCNFVISTKTVDRQKELTGNLARLNQTDLASATPAQLQEILSKCKDYIKFAEEYIKLPYLNYTSSQDFIRDIIYKMAKDYNLEQKSTLNPITYHESDEIVQSKLLVSCQVIGLLLVVLLFTQLTVYFVN